MQANKLSDLFASPPKDDWLLPVSKFSTIGGTTPKFYCAYKFNGETINLKIKYDQQYNSVLKNWGRPNEEVYASVVSQRLLWGMGFGADQST